MLVCVCVCGRLNGKIGMNKNNNREIEIICIEKIK